MKVLVYSIGLGLLMRASFGAGLESYHEAYKAAEAEKKRIILMLEPIAVKPDSSLVGADDILVSVDWEESKTLRSHPSLRELDQRPGVALIDFRPGTKKPGHVSAALPGIHLDSQDRWDHFLSHGPGLATLRFFTDYEKAQKLAQQSQRMLLIAFESRNWTLRPQESDVPWLQNFVVLRIPNNYSVKVDDKETVLIDHSFFSELTPKHGIAIIDYRHWGTPHYGQLVSVLPAHHLSPSRFHALLKLPKGTLSQRTMAWAMRVHPCGACAANGNPDHRLMRRAESHSNNQAQVRNISHNGAFSSEIVAMNQAGHIVDAALQMVSQWRNSSGHWSIMRPYHRHFGVDLKRSPSGEWYGTGAFY